MNATHSRFARIPEPELMLEEEQARVYAAADFETAHAAYPRLFRQRFPSFPRQAAVLDLGCGPCDVTWRFARLSTGWRIDAVDGSPAMLAQAGRNLKRRRLQHRIRLIQGLLPNLKLPRKRYDVILASSLLHHLPDPLVLWRTVARFAKHGTILFVADLRRPRTTQDARRLVEEHSSGEPEVLRRDFHNSLLAAFTPEEVRAQLSAANLTAVTVEPLNDRHLLALGTL
jgi:ubiquinone/menaquinone biosynthesis C-methylase UbiE